MTAGPGKGAGPGSLATAAVRQLAPYVIGKPISELARELGVDDIIKLASNENPLGPSPLAHCSDAAGAGGCPGCIRTAMAMN